MSEEFHFEECEPDVSVIKARHMENVHMYGMTHGGVVPTQFMKTESLDALYESIPDMRAYPVRVRRYCERGYYRDFKKDIQRKYRFVHVDMKRLKEQYGQHLADLAPELVDKPNRDLFAFVRLVKNEVILQGCYNTNHYDNENPNRNQANKTRRMLKSEHDRRQALSPEERQTLLFNDLMEVKDIATGTEGAV